MRINKTTTAPISSAGVMLMPRYINIPATINIITGIAAMASNAMAAIPIALNNLFIVILFLV